MNEREFTCPACGQAGGDGYDHRLDAQFDRLMTGDQRHPMSRGWRIAAITGVWVAAAAAIALGAVFPWFRQQWTGAQWVTGLITGWLLCSAVRDRRLLSPIEEPGWVVADGDVRGGRVR